ncbi:MAG: hypothetical protein KGQ49_06930, partial [Verrucomicrobia bacterium]|nr:hypothetical protein [Verrucomicrobiota bacterium]
MNQRPLLQLTPERHMTLALRQSLEVLQMPQLELAAWLLSEMEKNPLLELAAPKLPKLPKLKGRFEADVAAPITLHEHIAGQIRDHFADA